MYDHSGLSGNIAAPSRTDLIRQFYLSQRTPTTVSTSPWPTVTPPKPAPVAPAPSPWPTVTPTTFAPKPVAPTITVKPVTPTMPVLKLPAPAPVSSGGSGTPSGGSTAITPEVMTMDAGGGFKDTLAAFTKSPLPIIIFGLIALAMSEKKGR